MKPIIAISMGDYNGIGPEVILKSVPVLDLNLSTPLLIGKKEVFEYYSSHLNLPLHIIELDNATHCRTQAGIGLIDCLENHTVTIDTGAVSKEAGLFSMKAVEIGAQLCLKQKAHALVTAPISKESIGKAGYRYAGHTEYLADLASVNEILMLMVSDNLRVGLLTTHIPLTAVSDFMSVKHILLMISRINRTLHQDFGIPNPRIAVLGLNPHAGDGGVIGNEEIQYILPAIEAARSNQVDVGGPFPADGFFGNGTYKNYDGVLAMYHDQGLIPFKTLTFGKGVNFTAGLPYPRTSPDHGTAFDLSGMGQASPDSFISAYNLAVKLALNQINMSK